MTAYTAGCCRPDNLELSISEAAHNPNLWVGGTFQVSETTDLYWALLSPTGTGIACGERHQEEFPRNVWRRLPRRRLTCLTASVMVKSSNVTRDEMAMEEIAEFVL